MIASTPFRMRVTGVSRRLDELAGIDTLCERDGIRWGLALGDARIQAERRLQDLDARLHALQRGEIAYAERRRAMESFASDRSELLKALRRIRHLVIERFPDVLGET
jgi:hypothetical protein